MIYIGFIAHYPCTLGKLVDGRMPTTVGNAKRVCSVESGGTVDGAKDKGCSCDEAMAAGALMDYFTASLCMNLCPKRNHRSDVFESNGRWGRCGFHSVESRIMRSSDPVEG